MTEGEIVKAHCNKCLRTTNQKVLFAQARSESEEINEYVTVSGGDRYSLISCAGCDDVRMLHQHWFSEDMDHRGNAIIHSDYYPPSLTRQKPRWMREIIPFHVIMGEVSGLCDEIYRAIGVGASRLAVMGIRALVEHIMIDKIGDQGTFKKNIAAFFAGGYVAPIQQAIFKDTLIESGHAAMHRGFDPSPEEVGALLDIVEGIVETIYYQPMRVGSLKNNIPPARKSSSSQDA